MFLSSFDHVTILLFILQVTISAKSRLEHQLTKCDNENLRYCLCAILEASNEYVNIIFV